jgi:histidine triad (HIT) family protein
MSANCVFCKIVAGQIPSSKVHEDPETLAFLDINPVVKGHVLVIPKHHYDTLPQMPPEALRAVMLSVQRVMRALTRSLKADGVNLFQANGAAAGQEVPHVHFHVIPRFASDAHAWNWRQLKYDNPAEASDYATRIRAALQP